MRNFTLRQRLCSGCGLLTQSAHFRCMTTTIGYDKYLPQPLKPDIHLPMALNVSNACVLVVEDHEDTRFMLRTMLELRGGINVVEANNGVMAIDLAASLHPALDAPHGPRLFATVATGGRQRLRAETKQVFGAAARNSRRSSRSDVSRSGDYRKGDDSIPWRQTSSRSNR